MKLYRTSLILITLLILPFILYKSACAVTFTIDTVDTNAFNPTTTPTLNWTASATSISAKLVGTSGTYQKTGIGFPTSRWSISFENVKTGLYNVTLISGVTTITFKINATNTYYSATGTSAVTPTLAPMQQYVTGESDMTFMLLGAGVLVLLFSIIASKRTWKF
jgi:hypothetical protein